MADEWADIVEVPGGESEDEVVLLRDIFDIFLRYF